MGRQIALLGDAELDEGAVWEAIADPWVARLGEVLWVVDLNRQSLDRVVPDIAFGRLAGMFEAAGWQVLTVKYGRRLGELFERPGGAELRKRIDEMPNEEYQRLLRAPAEDLRERLPGRSRKLARLVAELEDADLRAGFRDLGGHDLGQPDRRLPGGGARSPDGPVRLHDQGLVAADRGAPGEPLGAADRRPVRGARGASSARTRTSPWAPFEPGSPEDELCSAAAAALAREEPAPRPPPAVPASLGRAAPRQRVDPAGLRPLLRGPRARGARGGRAGGDGESRRGVVDQPRRLDQQGGDLVGGRPQGLVRGRHPDARALARDHGRPAHRARHRRDEPGGPARRARRHLEPLRPAAAADRHHLRPVRGARARALGVRDVRGRAVDPDRHAERRLARAGGRRPPVDRHALDRHRPAGLHRLGARLRAGPRVDAAPRPRRGSAGRAASPPTSGSRPGRSTSRSPPAHASRCSPAAMRCAAPGSGPGSRWWAWARCCRRCWRLPTCSATTSTCSASRAPISCSAPSVPAPASASTPTACSASCCRPIAPHRS